MLGYSLANRYDTFLLVVHLDDNDDDDDDGITVATIKGLLLEHLCLLEFDLYLLMSDDQVIF